MSTSTSDNSLEILPIPRPEVLAWWRHTRSDDWWLSQQPISYGAMDKILSKPYGTTAQAITLKKNTGRTLDRISRLINDIESRKICFPRHKIKWYRGFRAVKFLLFNHPVPLPQINRMALESLWCIWSVCRDCGGNKFMPVFYNGKPHVACYRCIPSHQFPGLGIKRVEKSLMHEALKKYY